MAMRSDESSGYVVVPSRAYMDDDESRSRIQVPEYNSRRIQQARYPQLIALLEETNIDELKYFIEENLENMNDGEFIQRELAELCRNFVDTDIEFHPDIRPKVLIGLLKDVLQQYETKFKLFDISLESVRTLEGSALAARIDESAGKVSDLLESMQRRINDAEGSVCHLEELYKENMETIRAYEVKIWNMFEKILHLKRDRYVDEPPIEDLNFSRELQQHLEETINLNSSFTEELSHEQRTKYDLLQEICRLKERRIYDEHQKMKEIAEIAKDLELDEGIRNLIVEKIKTLTSNREEINTAVNQWMNEVHASIGPKQVEIDDMKRKLISLEDEIAEVELKCRDSDEEFRLLLEHLSEVNSEIFDRKEELERQQDEFENMNQSMQTSTGSYSYSSSEPSRTPPQNLSRSPNLNTQSYDERRSYVASPGGEISPHSQSGFSTNLNMQSYHERSPYAASPGSEISSRSQSPFSQNLNSTQSYHERGSYAASPGNEISSRSQSPFSPEIMHVNPSTQTVSQTMNRIDVGKSFNMRTIHSGTSTPYSQVTRVESIIPEAGSIRMSDSDFSVKHVAQVSPSQFVTPFISKMSRHGYTKSKLDPISKVLNIPPDDDLIIGGAVKKAVILDSPRREEPLLLNIDIDTQPLTQTSSGEQFICDVSLDVQQTGQLPRISPVSTFGVPPAVTPTTNRRHGLKTPTGIFKKRHFNVRRVYNPDEYQSPNLPWSPNILPCDYDSTHQGFPPSPILEDRSISWEKIPQPQDVMNKTFEASPGMNRTFNASPGMNKTFDAYSPQMMNRTFDAAPPRVMNRTFEASPPRVMNRTFEASPQVMNRTFDAAPPPDMNKAIKPSSPGVMNRTFESLSPRNKSKGFDTSSPNTMNKPLDTSHSRVLYRTFKKDQSSPLNRTFDTHSSSNRTSDTDKSYDQSLSPKSVRISPRSEGPSPQLNATTDRSTTSQLNRTYDKSRSREIDKTSDNEESQDPNESYGITSFVKNLFS